MALTAPGVNRCPTFDVARIKHDFTVFDDPTPGGRRLVFLDSAASSQKPTPVLEAMTSFYEHEFANVHRGVYALAEVATHRLESARGAVASFIGAASADEVVFTKNATESLNLIARSWGAANLGPNDAIVLSELEHHANIVPWFQLQAERGFAIRWIPVAPEGHLDLSGLEQLLDGAKLLSVTAMSNVTGALPPIATLVSAAHDAGALIALDGCQYVPHRPTDVAGLGIDFLAFSGHKMCGPTGIGVLWSRAEILDRMPPFIGGGGMILDVTTEGFRPDVPPARFEAGTPPIAEAVGLHAAIDYLTAIGMEAVCDHELQLTTYAMRTLRGRLGDQLTIHGPADAEQRGGVLSLELEGIHAHDVSQVLDEYGVCVRPGHHCAKPLMRKLGIVASARASLYLYNDEADVDVLAEALEATVKFFAI